MTKVALKFTHSEVFEKWIFQSKNLENKTNLKEQG